jgi:hypothetical protein
MEGVEMGHPDVAQEHEPLGKLRQINLVVHVTRGRCPQHWQAFRAATSTFNYTTPNIDHQHHLPGPPSRHQ